MENETEKKSSDHVLASSIFFSALIIAGAWVYTAEVKNPRGPEKIAITELEEKVLPSAGVTLPVRWGDLGAKLVGAGAIDADKFKAIYDKRGTFTVEYKNLLLEKDNGNIKITSDNAGYLLNLFWALGLANKNPILDSGEMTNRAYGGAQNFASTAGWTIAEGDPMNHYSRHVFFELTEEEQALVDKISLGVYRPCCDNSTHFPDCNHGMAMLGLLELMASQGLSEGDMWKTALTVNSYWFPDEYLMIAAYMKNNGVAWKDVDPKRILDKNFSSASGFAKIASQVAAPVGERGGGGCGVDNVGTVAPQQQSGCGI